MNDDRRLMIENRDGARWAVVLENERGRFSEWLMIDRRGAGELKVED